MQPDQPNAVEPEPPEPGRLTSEKGLSLRSPFCQGAGLRWRARWGQLSLFQCESSGRYCVLVENEGRFTLHEYDEVAGRWCESVLASCSELS